MGNDAGPPVEGSVVGFPDIFLFVLSSKFLAEVFTSHASVFFAVLTEDRVLHELDDCWVSFVLLIDNNTSLLANRFSGFDVITSAHSCSNTGFLESSNGVGNFVSQRVLDTEDS